MRPLTDLYTLGQCQKIPGFTREKFKEEARDLYREINRLIAGKDGRTTRRNARPRRLAPSLPHSLDPVIESILCMYHLYIPYAISIFPRMRNNVFFSIKS